MLKVSVRPWLIGVCLLAAGVVTRWFSHVARPVYREHAYEMALFEATWYATGFVIILFDLLRSLVEPDPRVPANAGRPLSEDARRWLTENVRPGLLGPKIGRASCR